MGKFYSLRIMAVGAVALAIPSIASADIIDDFSGGVTAVNSPEGAGAFGTYYDITSDAFAGAAAGTLDGSAALSITDGGFTNGVYVIYQAVVPEDGLYRLDADMQVIEDGTATNGIRAYQMGVVVNGAHRAVNPSDLAVLDPSDPGTAIGNYTGTLTAGQDNPLPILTVSTGEFFASAGDNLLVAFSTDLTGGNFELNSGTWGAGARVMVDNLDLVLIPEPTTLGLLGLGGLGLLRRRRA